MNKELRTFVQRGVLISASLTCFASHAATITLNFAHGGTGVGLGAEGYGNDIVFSNAGLSVTASGYGLTDNQGSLLSPDYHLEAAEVTQWSTGLGVCNQSEGTILNGSCSTGLLDEHQIDSAGKDDFIVLAFSQTVAMTSAVIDPYQFHDRDVGFWIGNVDLNSFSLDGERESDIAGLVGSSKISKTASASSAPLELDLEGLTGNVLVLKAGDNQLFDLEDYFKFASITVETVEVPLPAGAWLFGSALMGLLRLSYDKKNRR